MALLAACGDDGGGGADATAEPDGSSTTGVDNELAAACPDPIVIQDAWFPQAESGPLYSMIGPGGKIDASAGRYSGEIGDTGVTLEIRSGGPYLGQQSVSALMYQDDAILLGRLNQDVAVNSYGRTPTIGVMAFWEKHPVSLSFDPASFDFDEIGDIADSDATLLYFAGTTFVDYLVGEGLVREEQLDSSFDGSLSRFVADADNIVLHTVVTNEPWRLENELDAWGKPIESFMLFDAGYELYQTLAARPETIDEEGDCLKALIPMIQQAAVDYLENPEAAHEAIIDVVTEFDTFWTQSAELTDFAHENIVELGVIGNGPDDTLGNFDMDRVDRMLGILKGIYDEKAAESYDPSVTRDQLVTNEFIDPSIGA